MRRTPALLSALLTAVVGAAVLAPAAASAAPLPAPTAAGADVAQPQCDTPLVPGAQAFAIVGVNGGVATTTNRCLAVQLDWAATSTGGAGAPRLDVYVNTADPGLAAAWWPSANRTRRGVAVQVPEGRCTHTASVACAYVYGASIALDDVELRGVPAGAASRWWLDVETANTWSSSTARNRAVLEGMTHALQDTGHAVGLYALSGEFRDLIGTVPASSPIAELPSWLAGDGGVATAARRCTAPALALGRTLLAQVPGSGAAVDRDVVCHPFTSAPRARITGTHAVGRLLTARTAAWHPGTPRLTYRWNRDGHPITKATGRTHRVVRADSGHRLTVTVTAVLTGYSRTATTSKAVSAHR